jgi:hypothetical protein
VSLTPRFPPLGPTSPLHVPLLRHLVGQHWRSLRALSPLWLPYPPQQFLQNSYPRRLPQLRHLPSQMTHHLVRGRPHRLPKSDGRWESELLGHVVSPELPCAGRWVPEPRRHVAPSELPCAGRWELESRGHLAPLELPYVGRRLLELRRHVAPRSYPEPGGGSRSRGDTWRPRSCPAPGGGCWSPGDMWQPRSREAGTTPPPPLPRPSVGGLGVVVPVTPPDNPHRMITRGKTGFSGA